MPFIRSHGYDSVKTLTTGVSMGAYHAGNFLFRHPDLFDATIVRLSIKQLYYSDQGSRKPAVEQARLRQNHS